MRIAGLKSIQEVVNDPQLKLTQAKDVQWLSHENAVRNLWQCLPSVLTSLEREATERNDAQAHGLAVFVKDLLHLFTSCLISYLKLNYPEHSSKPQLTCPLYREPKIA